MAFYLDLLLDVEDLSTSLAYSVNAAGYEVAVVYLAVPKTFDNDVEFLRIKSSIVADCSFFDSKGTLLCTAVHDTDQGRSFIHKPLTLQYRPVSGGPLKDLRFEIVDEDDNKVEFSGGKVLVVLHFKVRH